MSTRTRETLVFVAGFLLVGALSFITPWTWWQLAAVVFLPWLAVSLLVARRAD